MSVKRTSSGKKFMPGSLSESTDIFDFPFTKDESTITYLKNHGRMMFIIRGPPGTGKGSMSEMLIDQFSGATVCSADSYFDNTFSVGKRGPESLRLSHEFCHSLVKTACENDDHPIIVKNTHMKKSELQTYLDFAAEYNYTVIMVVTVHKFEVTPEILAKSNTKGLTVEYFKGRLRQWQEVIPVLVGWFLSPGDSSHLLNEVQTALESLLGDGKFCRVLDVFDEEGILRHYKAKKLLYCFAACGMNNYYDELGNYYLSEKVQEEYGKCFTLTIIGYLVTPSLVSAVVHLDPNQKALQYKPHSKKHRGDDIDSLIRGLQGMELNENLTKHSQTVPFDAEFKYGETTAVRKKTNDKAPEVDGCGCMILAEAGEATSPMKCFESFCEVMKQATDVNGAIRSDQVIELDGNVKAYRLPDDAWFVKLPYELSFKSVYTGLYV